MKWQIVPCSVEIYPQIFENLTTVMDETAVRYSVDERLTAPHPKRNTFCSTTAFLRQVAIELKGK
jgi:hypothetical protein